jgi:Flp pilus assembly protein TadG
MRHQEFNKRPMGVAIIELAITLPLLLFLMFATIEIGRAFMQYNTLTKAVRDGVRHLASSALYGQTGTILIDANLLTQTQNLVVYGNLNGAGTPVLPDFTAADVQATASSAEDIVVTATYSYQPFAPIIPGFGVGDNRSSLFTFQAQASMRAL